MALASAVAVAMGGSGVAEGRTSLTANASALDEAPEGAQARGARGTVTLCSGLPPDVARGFNRSHQRQGLRLRIVGEGIANVPLEAAHDEFVRRMRERSRRCDVLDLDVIWMAEFAASRLAS